VADLAGTALGNGSRVGTDIGPALAQRVIEELGQRIEIGAGS
jgi:hypothetical protein